MRGSSWSALPHQSETRTYDSVYLDLTHPSFGFRIVRRKKDANAMSELVKRLEEKLLPVPGRQVFMTQTELTVGEWNLYLKAAGLPERRQDSADFAHQTDEHPVANLSWSAAMKFCEWLSKATGREWNLPSNAEWDAVAGKTKYPWGDYFPPNWDDGNYQIQRDGSEDPEKKGLDGIKGTSPVGSFKPNSLGFYDLGGNVWEWTRDGDDSRRNLRGSSWSALADQSLTSFRDEVKGDFVHPGFGFRVIRR
jgi:formylglycine-generating enzyme required for sulfatase activity